VIRLKLFADSTHRGEYLATNGYTELSGNHALSRGIATSRRIGDIRNKVTITYKNGDQHTAEDTASQSLYGVQAQNILTSIENGADATSQANFYLALRAYPQSLFKAILYQIGIGWGCPAVVSCCWHSFSFLGYYCSVSPV